MLDRLRARVRSLLLRRRVEREMQDEMAEHLLRATDLLIARGIAPEEARRQALREFGNVGWHQERGREARGARWLEELLADLRYGLRHLARTPGTTAVMIVVLAFGMAVSSLMFSFIHAMAVQPPTGVELRDDLVRIRGSRTDRGGGRVYRTFSEEEVRAYSELSGPFETVAPWAVGGVVVDAGGGSDRTGLEARVAFVTGDFFPVIGVRPLLGPGLPSTAATGPAVPVAVIGFTVWDRLFGRSPDAIGSSLKLNGVPVTIVGVTPERFYTGLGDDPFVLWMPLASRELILPGESPSFLAIARLRRGADRATATAAVASIPARLANEDPVFRSIEPATDVVPLLAANDDPGFEQGMRLMRMTFGLLGGLVLVITCMNVSALLTGLAAARRHEIAIRLALGAGRARILRQLLTESALLATVAAASALGLVWAVLRGVNGYVPEMRMEIPVAGPTTAFTFGVALAVGVLFGLSPALHATRLAVAGALRDSTAAIVATRARLQKGLVVAQVAFTQPLIVLVAALLISLLADFRQQAVGRTELADRVVFVALAPPARSGFAEAAAAAGTEHRAATMRLLERVRGTPGVEAAVLDWRSPHPLGFYVAAQTDSAAAVPLQISADRAGPGYFSTMGIRLLRGRDFEPADPGVAAGADLPTIVGAGLARRAFPGADPIGRRLRPASDTATGLPTLVVVGVVDDPVDRSRGLGETHWIYLPPDTAGGPMGMLARTAGEAASLVPTLRAHARDVAPSMSPRVRPLAEIAQDRVREYRWIAAGVSTAGAIALLLSAIGLYAVVAFSVAQRTAEIAVRLAVGGSGGRIARRFLTDALTLSALGLAFGLPASLVALRVMRTLEDDLVAPLPPVAAIAAVAVGLVTIAAAWIPARRAAAVDPAVILRSD